MSVVHDLAGADPGLCSQVAVSGGGRRSGSAPAADARQLELLERAVTAALTPLDFPDVIAWGEALTRAFCALADAHAGAVLLPVDSTRWRAVIPVAFDSAVDPRVVHEEATERFRELSDSDLVLWARDDLAGPPAQHPAPPSRTTVGLRVRAADGSIAAVCVFRDDRDGSVPSQLIAAFRAIAPALRAGVAAWASANSCRANVGRMLDSLADPALMFDVAGTLVHANPAVDRLIRLPDGARVRDEAQRLAWSLGALARRRIASAGQTSARPLADVASDRQVTRRIRIGGAPYHLRGSVVGEQLLGAEPGVLVTITTEAAEPLSDDTLQSEFGLTAREVEVARLIAAGLSNSEIAERLGVRFFTARNHVERTLAKLGVSSRHRVGPLLRAELSENGKHASAA